MKRILVSAALIIGVGVFMVFELGVSNPRQSFSVGTYYIMVQNAFGLTQDADFKIAGLPAGKITDLTLPAKCVHGGGNQTCDARVEVNVKQRGWGQFHQDAFCQTRPQSLIGEYFIECQPGQSGKVLPPGSTIPVQNTESTIPVDLINNIQQLPYRQRLTLIINELGAAVAGRSTDLEAALKRAIPALDQLDNLLNLLANDSRTLQQLTSDSNTVISALADNSTQVQRFIDEANRISVESASQAPDIAGTWRNLPPFLEQLKPTLAKLSTYEAVTNPVLQNLITLSAGRPGYPPGQLQRLFNNLSPCSVSHRFGGCGFPNASIPSTQALGNASKAGVPAVQAAEPTVAHLDRLTGPSGCQAHNLSIDQRPGSQYGPVHGFIQTCLPELATNLAGFLTDIDNQNRAVEPDSRSPGGKGFSGTQALLWYLFVQPLSINSFNQFGHMLNINAYIDPRCSPYATPQSIANNLQSTNGSARQCYAWLGPSQPGINETDPSRTSACVPDPEGTVPGQPAPHASAPCTLPASPTNSKSSDTTSAGSGPTPSAAGATPTAGGGGSGLGGLISAITGRSSSGSGTATSNATDSSSSAGSGGSSSGSSGGSSGRQAQALLNYLIAP